MAALTSGVRRATAYPGQGYISSLYAETADTLYEGAMLSFESDGNVKVSADANEDFAGICMEDTVVTSAGTRVPVLRNTRFWITMANADEDDLGDLLQAISDNDVEAHAANQTCVGRIVGVRGSGSSAEVLVDTLDRFDTR